MRRYGIVAAWVVTMLVGCASPYKKPLPEGYTGPTSTIRDTAVSVRSSLIHMFQVSEVDGQRIVSGSAETSARNSGRGFAITPYPMTNKLPSGKEITLTISGGTMHAAPILAMTNPTCWVSGEVKFVPVQGEVYKVVGEVGDDQCSVWLERDADSVKASDKVLGKGLK
jgi:hypothetical protein